MGNYCCRACTDCFYSEKNILKESLLNNDELSTEVCGYPFCNTNMKIIRNDELLVEFRGIIYCSSQCINLHKKLKWIGYGWSN